MSCGVSVRFSLAEWIHALCCVWLMFLVYRKLINIEIWHHWWLGLKGLCCDLISPYVMNLQFYGETDNSIVVTSPWSACLIFSHGYSCPILILGICFIVCLRSTMSFCGWYEMTLTLNFKIFHVLNILPFPVIVKCWF